MVLGKGQNIKRWSRSLRTRGPSLWTAVRSRIELKCAWHSVLGALDSRWMGHQFLGMPLSENIRGVEQDTLLKPWSNPYSFLGT